MTDYEIYVFFLCLIVFVMLTALSIVCLTIITRLSLRLINHGVEDEKILEEYRKKQGKKSTGRVAKILDYSVSGVVCLVFVAMLVGSLVIRCTENSCCGALPTYRVVRTGSMSEKNGKNDYLFENNLDNQIQTFDLIRTEELPDEMDLELYDVVVYETDGMLIIHRIVEIEEPNENHPNCRHFRLQGDAVDAPDRFPVLYEQMKAIYRGERTQYIGSFVLFMQSPAGWLCTLLIIIAMIASPILDKKLEDARKKRLALLVRHYDSVTAKEPATVGGGTDD